MIERIERLGVKLICDGKIAEKYKREIELITDETFEFIDTDQLILRYGFDIKYIGQCEETIAAIIKLIDTKEFVIDADLKEHTYGVCLVGQLFERVKELKDRLENG